MANAMLNNNDVVAINYDEDELTTFLNSIACKFPSMEDIEQNEKAVEEENIQKRQQYSTKSIKRYSKKIRHLEKEKDTLSRELLVLRVQFDNLNEKVKILEDESRKRKTSLSEIKKLLRDLKRLK